MKYQLSKPLLYGIQYRTQQDLFDAKKELNAGFHISWKTVTCDEYENSVLDLRFEEGEWKQ